MKTDFLNSIISYFNLGTVFLKEILEYICQFISYLEIIKTRS